MDIWEDVQKKKAEMQKAAVSALSAEEREVLLKALELEWDNRHLKTPGVKVKGPLRNFIQQVIK